MPPHVTNCQAKILVVSTNADWSGAPIHVLTLLSRLTTEFEFVAVFGDDGPVPQALRLKGIACRVIPTLRSQINPIADLRCLWSFIQLVRLERPDVLHAHSSKAGMIARLTGWLLGIPCIYTVHGWGFGEGRSKIQSALVLCIERIFALIPGTRFIFVCEADGLVGLKRLRLDPARCITIHNGVPDHGARADVATSTTVIMAARVCHAKHHDLLLKAFEGCEALFKLVLVGEGTDTPSFKRRVMAHTPTRHTLVECLGLSDQIPVLLARAGVFVLCSRHEALPLSIIEAMCAGLPIVATDVGGVGELVEHSVNGFLVPANDQMALTRCLDRLQKTPAMRLKMGTASRSRYVTGFSETRMAALLALQYRVARHGDTQIS